MDARPLDKSGSRRLCVNYHRYRDRDSLVSLALAAWYAEPGVDLYQGDCRAVMAQMAAESVDCCVFSPPFFGLRKYDGVQELVWGGKDGCEHEWRSETFQRRSNDSNPGAMQRTNAGSVGRDEPIGHATCSLCGAWRGAWGLEPSVEMWVSHTVEVMQSVKRVLKNTGGVWIEVGDSYFSGDKWGGQRWQTISGFDNLRGYPEDGMPTQHAKHEILKPKDLCLVPERLALALQAGGWWVRSRIVWARPNPMPESVDSRPTKSHSVIWMLTKSPSYFWDSEAVRERHGDEPTWADYNANKSKQRRSDKLENYGMASKPGSGIYGEKLNHPSGRNLRDLWTFPTAPFGYELCHACGQIYTAAQFGRLPERAGGHRCKCQGQDGHTEWQEAIIEDSHDGLGVMMQPAWLCPDCETIYSLAEWNGLPQGRERQCRCGATDFLSHFATFPEALPTRCILASTSEAGCCPKCGKPWERVIEKVQNYEGARRQDGLEFMGSTRGTGWKSNVSGGGKTLGWAATCKCGLPQAENVPATVLDLCCGSGTSVLAAKKLGRRAVGIDLSEKYLALARRRLSEVPMTLKGG